MPTKIRILHLIKSLGRGGAEKLIPETALVHHKDRFEFHCLYFYHQRNNIVDELEAAGIQVHLIPSGNLGLFFQVNKVRAFAKQLGIDIIHAHLPWAGIMARSVGNNLKIPIVYTEHNTWDRYNTISYWGNRMSFKNQDIAIAVSNEVALSMQLNSMIDPYQRGGRMKIKVIQNGVNTDVFRRMSDVGCRIRHGGQVPDVDSSPVGSRELGEAISQVDFSLIGNSRPTPPLERGAGGISLNLKDYLKIPPNAKTIGIVAVFRDQKRLWIWIDLALKILQKSPETHFVLVGDGEWRSRLEKQIEESGKSANFHLVGVQKQVIPYLSIMDIYLSTSEFEGLPIAMLEAMSCEVPVVATRAGGIGEVIQHGVQGFLSEIDEYGELVDYCVLLIKDQDLHQSMSLAARERVVAQFSMKRMVAELEGVYESVIGKESGREKRVGE
ncbi:glycosyltransferase [Algoriphagus aquimarinus]|uniref:Glycosyltransferase n=1 Tax=Algoriphagus aquimarinus TaxID=237018 RepID=A0A5C7AG46_9BACT|nr:glycosyltransferase [Algoriphagus aquimarinus]TXE02398.1 glycosyltransferase [Algoriphagus aquimarinus]